MSDGLNFSESVDKTSRPLVSVGLPVYNGMPYLEQAVESILSQTYENLELVIGDNDSDDGSREYCEQIARQDSRVQLFTHPRNLGAAPNYNFVFQQAKGDYFKWAAADDLCELTFLERCLEPLESNREFVVSYPQTRFIDGAGDEVLDICAENMHMEQDSAFRRFAIAVFRLRKATSVFGLIRRDTLAKTGLIGAFPSSDLVLMTELALLGKFYEVPEPLFLKREHPGNSMYAYSTMRSRAEWFATEGGSGHTHPRWRLVREYARVVERHVESPTDRVRFYACLSDLVRRMWPRMIKEAFGFTGESQKKTRAA